VCVRHCRFDSLTLRKQPARIRTPETIMERMMIQALERGKFQNLLFDDPKRLSHRFLGTLVRVVLTSPPARAALAREQVKSTFVRMALNGLKRAGQA
jgi:hypothetical protein